MRISWPQSRSLHFELHRVWLLTRNDASSGLQDAILITMVMVIVLVLTVDKNHQMLHRQVYKKPKDIYISRNLKIQRKTTRNINFRSSRNRQGWRKRKRGPWRSWPQRRWRWMCSMWKQKRSKIVSQRTSLRRGQGKGLVTRGEVHSLMNNCHLNTILDFRFWNKKI